MRSNLRGVVSIAPYGGFDERPTFKYRQLTSWIRQAMGICSYCLRMLVHIFRTDHINNPTGQSRKLSRTSSFDLNILHAASGAFCLPRQTYD